MRPPRKTAPCSTGHAARMSPVGQRRAESMRVGARRPGPPQGRGPGRVGPRCRLDEDLGRQTFGKYARTWLRDHPRMGPRYRETCERNLRLHLVPLRDVPLRALTPTVVREWHASALRGGRTSIQQTRRFLRAVVNTAVRDGAVVKNPQAAAGKALARPDGDPRVTGAYRCRPRLMAR